MSDSELPTRMKRALSRVLALPSHSVFVVLLVMLGYLLVSRGVANLYPFSTFPMYAGTSEQSSANRVMARDENGAEKELSAFVDWTCEEEPELHPSRCRENGDYYTIGYLERAYQERLGSRVAESVPKGAVPLQIFRRIWRFADDGSTSVEDCDLVRCMAVPK